MQKRELIFVEKIGCSNNGAWWEEPTGSAATRWIWTLHLDLIHRITVHCTALGHCNAYDTLQRTVLGHCTAVGHRIWT